MLYAEVMNMSGQSARERGGPESLHEVHITKDSSDNEETEVKVADLPS